VGFSKASPSIDGATEAPDDGGPPLAAAASRHRRQNRQDRQDRQTGNKHRPELCGAQKGPEKKRSKGRTSGKDKDMEPWAADMGSATLSSVGMHVGCAAFLGANAVRAAAPMLGRLGTTLRGRRWSARSEVTTDGCDMHGWAEAWKLGRVKDAPFAWRQHAINQQVHGHGLGDVRWAMATAIWLHRDAPGRQLLRPTR
jgi:hypothetical protein